MDCQYHGRPHRLDTSRFDVTGLELLDFVIPPLSQNETGCSQAWPNPPGSVPRAKFENSSLRGFLNCGENRTIGGTESRSDGSIKAQGQATRAERALTPPWVRGTNQR